MRELKFRVFFYDGEDETSGEYMDAEQCLSEDFIELAGYSLQATDECSIIEQFTGLHDKNGKEIYENDVVLDEDGNRYICQWNVNGHWHFKVVVSGGIFPIDYWLCEVIGNIHETPELLE